MKQFILFLTLSRLFFAPIIFLGLVVFNNFILTFVLFLIASVSDYFDGLLARRYGLASDFGAILDPIADKILLLFCLFAITLYLQDPYVGLISLIILAREFWVSALRDFASRNKISDLMDVTYLAKVKTSIQFLTLFLYFASFLLNLKLGIFVANITLFLSMLITIKTGIDYTKKILKI
ncbi:CDP-alcohol phosphatidyltransferase family protein [SAR86 cluster bacterium]|nr:CDP-alcohol phosphatidyltransferase family protein [SAR86 cluster bacterium]